MWTKNNIPDLAGKTAIVTGANTGIGFETAKGLYEAGAHVVLAARDARKAAEAISRIRTESGERGSLEPGFLNLANLNQVRDFAQDIERNHMHLDILVNNAGVMIPPASTTDDGFELQFGVNFLGHFALTAHLFPLLRTSPQARVITLSSGAAIHASGIDFDNLRLEKSYDEWREYAVSKLADILFTRELDRKLRASELNIISAAAHPGVTRTDLQRHIPEEQLAGMLARFEEVMEPWQGALPTLFAATDPAVKGGEFYGPDGQGEYTGYPALSKHSTEAMNDQVLAAQLWDFAEKSAHINFSL